MVKFLFIEAAYNGEVKLTDEVLGLLKDKRSVALFSSVQFVKSLESVKKQLAEKSINALTTKAKRTAVEGQLLGCDCAVDSFEDKEIFDKVDAVLYIGDGMFHPKALLLCQQDLTRQKDVIVFDPITNSAKTLTRKDIEKQKNKYQANLLSYLSAKKIGILVSTKTGQQYLNIALELKKKKDKEYFIFIGDNFDLSELENFNFIDVWVNSACPRIGTDDLVNIHKPLININDVFKS